MHVAASKATTKADNAPVETAARKTAVTQSPQQIPLWAEASLPTIQFSLKINTPGDKYEQEADRIADQVMRMPKPAVQRKTCACGQPAGPAGMCKDCKRKQLSIHRKATREGTQTAVQSPALTPSVGAAIQSLHQGSGRPLDPPMRRDFEVRFGYDFGRVRIHTGSKAGAAARAVQAQAYTLGQNIVFGEGQYNPASEGGRRLLAHELTHVIHQGQARRLRSGVGQAGEESGNALLANSTPLAAPLSIAAPNVIQRVKARCLKHLKETRLSRVCKPPGTPRGQGTKIHSELQKQWRDGKTRYAEVQAPFAAKDPPIEPSVAVLKKKLYGRIDLLKVTRRTARTVQVQVGEIKPLNAEGVGSLVESEYYAAKIREAGPECLSPRTPEDMTFCRTIDAIGKTVTVKTPSGLSWSPGRFAMNLYGVPRQLIALSCWPGLTAYRCLGEADKKKKDKKKPKQKGKDKGKAPKAKSPSPKVKAPKVKVPKGAVSPAAGKGAAKGITKGAAKKAIPGAAYVELAMFLTVIAAGGKPAFGAEGMSTEEALVEIIRHGPPPDVKVSKDLLQLLDENPDLKDRLRKLAEGEEVSDEVIQEMYDLLEANKDLLDAETLEALIRVSEGSKQPAAKQTAEQFRKALEAVKSGATPGEGAQQAPSDAEAREADEDVEAAELPEAGEKEASGKTGEKGGTEKEALPSEAESGEPEDTAQKAQEAVDKGGSEPQKRLFKLIKDNTGIEGNEKFADDFLKETQAVTDEDIGTLLQHLEKAKPATLQEILDSIRAALAAKKPEESRLEKLLEKLQDPTWYEFTFTKLVTKPMQFYIPELIEGRKEGDTATDLLVLARNNRGDKAAGYVNVEIVKIIAAPKEGDHRKVEVNFTSTPEMIDIHGGSVDLDIKSGTSMTLVVQ